MFSGVSSTTSQKLQLDAGAFLKNYDPTSDTWATASTTKLLGATAGGGSFAAVPTIRRIEVDGVKGATKGFEALDEWVVTMTANMKELDADVLKMALATGSATDTKSPSSVTSNNYKKIVASNEIQLSDYVGNITWVGRLSGSALPIIIVLKNALCTNGLSLTTQDKAEGIVTLTLTGHYDPSNLDVPPFEIYYPTAAS
jgi:hypothetical protein